MTASPRSGVGLWLAAGLIGPVSAALAQTPTPARLPEYVSIVQEIHVDRPTDVVWRKVGGYCDLAGWLKTTCVYTSGSGGVGTNRLIAGRINEVMVAKTSTAYTYAQPLAPNAYHGTVEILPDGAGAKIIYSIFYDVAAVGDKAAKDADQARRAQMFMGALKAMKAAAEAP